MTSLNKFSLGVFTAALLLSGYSTALAQNNLVGEKEYEQSCAICHGNAGQGNGEFGLLLTVKPSDLTQLTANNDGVFPFLDVFQAIDGRAIIRGHGSPMPIWGATYTADVGDAAGPYGAELIVRARIVALIDYIEGLQI